MCLVAVVRSLSRRAGRTRKHSITINRDRKADSLRGVHPIADSQWTAGVERNGKNTMPKYLSLVEFTQQGIGNVEQLPNRLDDFRELVEDNDGEIVDYYGTMGQYDIVMVTEFPDAETAASVLLSTGKLGNVRSETLTAFTEEEFREMVTDLP